LIYKLGQTLTRLAAISATRIDTFDFPAAREIEEAVWAFRDVIDKPPTENRASNVRALNAALYRILITPIEAHVANQRIVIVADGILSAVPFGALGKPEGDGKGIHYFLQDHAITMVVTLDQLEANEEAKKGGNELRISIFGDPAFSATTSLPGARRETVEIKALFGSRTQLYLGRDATKQAVTNRLPSDTAVLHFATHGIVDSESRGGQPCAGSA